jgi:hypothetical protein
MAQIITQTVTLDNDFNPVAAGTTLEPEKTYVTKVSKFQKNYGIKGKEYDQIYTIFKGDKKVVLKENYLKEFKKNGINTAEEMMERMITANLTELKNPKARLFRDIAFFTFAMLAVGSIIAFMLLTTGKNFSNEVKPFTGNESVKVGDFVEVDFYAIDGFEIEVTTTRTNYGIETSKSTNKGNTYVLSAFDYENPQTFIVRYDADSALDKVINAATEEFFIENVRGEVKPLSSIEKLDSGEQVMEYFGTTLSEFDGLETPVYLIDNNVTQGNIAQVLAITLLVAALSIACLVAGFYFLKKNNTEIKDNIAKLLDKENRLKIA